MRKNGELLQYSWLMSEADQRWHPVDPMPKENPFQATQETMGERVISGAFLWLTRPYLGMVKGIHAFGLELLVDQETLGTGGFKNIGLKGNSAIQLNLVDETHGQWLNAKVIFQNAEDHGNGTLLRFGWSDAMVKI